MTDYLERNRAGWTKANEEYTDARAREAWAREEITWGMFRAQRARAGVLGDVSGKDVIELGCGTAYFGAWLAKRGARVTGVDITPAQLETARRMNEETGIALELVEANAEDVPLPDESFDLAVSEYGASIWCDPYKWIPEAARLLRPGRRARLPRQLDARDALLAATREGLTALRPQFGMHRIEWTEDDGSSSTSGTASGSHCCGTRLRGRGALGDPAPESAKDA